MASKSWIGIALLLVVLTASIYVMMPEKVKLVVGNTNTQLLLWDGDSFEKGATEYISLYNGSKKISYSSTTDTRTLSWVSLPDNITKVVRDVTYNKGSRTIHLVDEYYFDGLSTNIENVPIDHKIKCYGCEGLILQIDYKDIAYDGINRNAVSPEVFGRIKIVWDDSAYFAKVYNQVTSDKLTIKYRLTNSVEEYSVKMSDPELFTNTIVSKDSIIQAKFAFANWTAEPETAILKDGWAEHKITYCSKDKLLYAYNVYDFPETLKEDTYLVKKLVYYNVTIDDYAWVNKSYNCKDQLKITNLTYFVCSRIEPVNLTPIIVFERNCDKIDKTTCFYRDYEIVGHHIEERNETVLVPEPFTKNTGVSAKSTYKNPTGVAIKPGQCYSDVWRYKPVEKSGKWNATICFSASAIYDGTCLFSGVIDPAWNSTEHNITATPNMTGSAVSDSEAIVYFSRYDTNISNSSCYLTQNVSCYTNYRTSEMNASVDGSDLEATDGTNTVQWVTFDDNIYDSYIPSTLCSLGLNKSTMNWWSFNEGSGTTALDNCGVVNGTYISSPDLTSDSLWNFNYAVKADGVADYVQIRPAGTNQSYLNGENITILAWVRNDINDAGNHVIYDSGNLVTGSNFYGVHLGVNDNTIQEGLYFFIMDGDTNGNEAGEQTYDIQNMAVGQWFYVAAVYDSTAQKKRVYIDGILKSDVTATQTLAYQSDGCENIGGRRYGANCGTADARFNGLIDEVIVMHGTALTQQEIRRFMLATGARILNMSMNATNSSGVFFSTNGSTTATTNNDVNPDLVGMWAFEPSLTASGQLLDWSGNGKTLTVTGSPVYIQNSSCNKGNGQTSLGCYDIQAINKYLTYTAATATTNISFGGWVYQKGNGGYVLNTQHACVFGEIASWVPSRIALMTKDAATATVGVSVNAPGGAGLNPILTTWTLPNNEWHHLFVTVDGNSGTVKIYVDGILNVTKTHASGIGTWIPPTTIGNLLSAHWYQGIVDDYRAYNRSLSAAEVNASFYEPKHDRPPSWNSALIYTYSLAISSPTEGSYITDNEPDVVFESSADGNCTMYMNGTAYGINESVSGGVETTIESNTTLADGLWYAWVVCNVSDVDKTSNNVSFTIDTTPPVFSNAINTSNDRFCIQDTYTSNITITDGLLISRYIFSSNETGSWINGSSVVVGASSIIASTTTDITATKGTNICWKYYANDSLSNEDSSDNYCFDVASCLSVVDITTANNTYFTDTTPTIYFNLTDIDNNDNQSCSYYVDGTLKGRSMQTCEQEFANVSTACGGLDTGVYTCAGDWVTGHNCSEVIDGDWDTYGEGEHTSGHYGAVYVNYTKPTSAADMSYVYYKSDGDWSGIPIYSPFTFEGNYKDCWDYNDTTLLLRPIVYSQNCIDIDSLINTPTGYIRAKDLKIGDIIYSYKDNYITLDVITQSNLVEVVKPMTYVYYDGGVLKATSDHLIYADGLYREASTLEIGMNLLSYGMFNTPITDIKTMPSSISWHLSVEDSQNFFVNNILVHNAVQNQARLDCYNGTGWETIEASYGPNGKIYEEKMVWRNGSVVLNANSSAEFYYNSSALSQGNHSYWMVCTDLDSLESTSQNNTLIVDTSTPVVDITWPANNSCYSTAILEINVSDVFVASTFNCTTYWNGTAYGTNSSVSNNTKTNITSSVANGAWNAWVTCSDGMNTGTSENMTMYIGNLDLKVYADGIESNGKWEMFSNTSVVANATMGTCPSANVCVDVGFSDYGINYSCGTNSTSFYFEIPYVEITTIYNSTTSGTKVNLSSNGTIWYNIKNWSVLNSTLVDIYSYGDMLDVTFDSDNDGSAQAILRGILNNNTLTENRWYDNSTTLSDVDFASSNAYTTYIKLSTEVNLTQNVTLYINNSQANPISFEYTPKFIDTSDYNDSGNTTLETPLFVFDDITSDVSGRWNYDTSGGGDAAFYPTSERVGTISDSYAHCSSPPSSSASDTESSYLNSMDLYIQNNERVDMNVNISCATSSSESDYGSGHATAETGIYLVTDDEGTIPNTEIYKLTCNAIPGTSQSYSGTLSVRKNSSNFDLYFDNVFSKTIVIPNGNSNIKVTSVTSSGTACGSIASSATGSGSAYAYINDISYGGIGTNYSQTTNNWSVSNGEYISDILLNTSSNIVSVVPTFYELQPGSSAVKLFVSADNRTNWKEATSGEFLSFTNPGTNFSYKVNISGAPATSPTGIYYINFDIISDYASGLAINTGKETNGTYYFYHYANNEQFTGNNESAQQLEHDNIVSGTLNITNTSDWSNIIGLGNFTIDYSAGTILLKGSTWNGSTLYANYTTDSIDNETTPASISLNYNYFNDYLTNSTYCSGTTCNIPLSMTTDSGSYGYVSFYNMTALGSVNDVNLNYSSFNLSSCATESCNKTINITNINNTIEFSNLRVDYYGTGNLTLTAHTNRSDTQDTNIMSIFYSPFSLDVYPSHVDYIDFFPATKTSKNVAPFGQTTYTPILRLTAENRDINMSFSQYMNDTYNCITVMASPNSSHTGQTTLLNSTWQNLSTTEYTYGQNHNIWLWANYSCTTATGWQNWYPQFSFKGCCDGCICNISN